MKNTRDAIGNLEGECVPNKGFPGGRSRAQSVHSVRVGKPYNWTILRLALVQCVAWEVICDAELAVSKDIRASQMTSQRLTEENFKRAPIETEIPEYL